MLPTAGDFRLGKARRVSLLSRPWSEKRTLWSRHGPCTSGGDPVEEAGGGRR